MSATTNNTRKYLLTFALGAIGGGLLAAWATRAVPRMMSGMMQNMMVKMREEGCDPMEV